MSEPKSDFHYFIIGLINVLCLFAGLIIVPVAIIAVWFVGFLRRVV